MSIEDLPFTLDRLDWLPRIELVDEDTATPLQREVLTEHAAGRTHPFTRTLVHDAAVFRERSLLAHASMSATDHADALPQAEREYSALVESRVTGCRYCAFVHANAALRLGADRDAVTSMIEQGLDAQTELSARYRAITDFTAALAHHPPNPTHTHIDNLRNAGLVDSEIVDLVFSVAQFSWANRTMLPLGETVAQQNH